MQLCPVSAMSLTLAAREKSVQRLLRLTRSQPLAEALPLIIQRVSNGRRPEATQQAFSQAHGLQRLLSKAFGLRQGTLFRLSIFEQGTDQPTVQGFLGIQGITSQQHVCRAPGTSHQRQQQGRCSFGTQAQVNERRTENG